jgi:hypothetical protein
VGVPHVDGESPARTTRGAIRIFILPIFLCTLLTSPAHAQSTPTTASHQVSLRVAEVTALALNDPGSLDLMVAPRSGMSAAPAGSAEGRKTLHYTTVSEPGVTRAISVEWKAGSSAPSGMFLKIAVTDMPDGCGEAAREVTVGTIPQSLITAIPSCTTDAAARGALLRYRVGVDDESLLTGAATAEVRIVFTIVDR